MKEIIKLALRNLKEHKSKTIIIGCFLILGVAIVVAGNSFLESINRGLEKDFRANYTGDIAIGTVPEKGAINDIFGVNSTNFGGEIPQLPEIVELDRVNEIVAGTKGIESATKLISAQVIMVEASNGEVDLSVITQKDDVSLDDIPISMLFSGEDDTYWKTFPDIHLVEGTFPEKGTSDILVDERVKKAYESLYETPLEIGTPVLLAGANSKGIVREAKVCGFIKPANEYSAMFQCIYCNPAFARSFADLTYANSFAQELPDTVDLSLSSMSEEDLFGGDDIFGDIDEFDSSVTAASVDFDNILGDVSLRDELNKTDDGAWHYVLIKVENKSKTESIISSLNDQFKKEGLNVYAMNWKTAAWSYSQTVAGIGIVFNTLIIILAVVVFIIIMNTMIVSVIERTSEIGTMRAIGAEKGFVRKLFFTESLILTLITSVIGVIISLIIMLIFNKQNIVITNSIVKMILGGGLIHFTPTVTIIISTIIITSLLGIISNLYPINSALKITPLKALSKE